MTVRSRLALLFVWFVACVPEDPSAGGTDTETTGPAEESGGGTTATGDPGVQTATGNPDPTGPGADASTSGEAIELPATPVLSLRHAPIKQFEFAWAPVDGAESYRLLERPDARASDYAQLGADLVDTAVAWTRPLHLRAAARYILRACNAAGCTDSQPVPVTDAMTAAIGYLKASNPGDNDRFGEKVAISADGTTLVVGAPGEASASAFIDGVQTDDAAPDAGAAYVFVREGDGWVQQAYLKPVQIDADDAFGQAVAISADGDTIVVGAHGEDSSALGVGGPPDDEGAPDSGAVHVFHRMDGAWSQQAYIKAPNTGAGDRFGVGLALSAGGDVLAVGAPVEASAATGVDGDPYDDSAPGAGAVHVYARVGESWTHRAYLKASNTGAGDHFGYPCALSGDGRTLVVGAAGEDSAAHGVNGEQADDSREASGAVYVFVSDGELWSQQAYLKASRPDSGDLFGYSLAISRDGDTLAVGAEGEGSAATDIDGSPANNDAPGAGAVYVFGRAGQAWSQAAYVKAPNAAADDRFGATVALSAGGSILAAAAILEDGADIGVDGDSHSDWRSNSGAVYVFDRRREGWTHRSYVKAPNSDVSDRFGSGLALSGDGGTLAIGAVGEASLAAGIGETQGDNSGHVVGAVYLY